ncbi:SDR family NAD(P)-dependent oxidoreductase [Bacteroidota bacterium]
MKTVLVTGATGAIGKAIVRNIAYEPENKIIMVIRDESKGMRVRDEIINDTGNSNVDYAVVDLSNKAEIFRLAKNMDLPVNVLVNNAAVTPRKRLETREGIELQWATNVLGYYWMITAFTPHLQRVDSARVVNVASYWAGGLDLNDPEFQSRRYHNDTAYRQSKQANRMMSIAFAENLEGIAVNACHPGDVNSKLSNDLGFGGHESPDEGARTPVWLATENAGIENTGNYFEHGRESVCQFSRDKNGIKELMSICSKY